MNSIQEVREMRTAEVELSIIREGRRSRKWSLESRVIRKSVKHGSEGCGWKSARKGNSLTAYPTCARACPEPVEGIRAGGASNCPPSRDAGWLLRRWYTNGCQICSHAS